MSSTKQVEEPQSTETTAEMADQATNGGAPPSAPTRKPRAEKAVDEPAKALKAPAKKKPAKVVEEAEDKPAPVRPRPAARPSIYEDITAAAKKLEAERAA